MRLDRRGTLWAAMPLGVTVFCWLTMRTEASLGSETGASYGFPLPWYAPSAASSMAYTVAVTPLVLDLLVYVAVAQAVLMAWRLRTASPPRRGLRVALWAAALASVAYAATGLMTDPRVVAWDPSPYFHAAADRSHRLQWGTGPWR